MKAVRGYSQLQTGETLMWGLPPPTEPTTHLSAILDVIDKGTKILALVIGAGWVYLNYLRGRTFKHRLEPNISGKTIRSKDVLLLSGLAQVKNVGLSKVLIQQKGTAIEVLGCVLGDSQAGAPKLSNQDVAVLSVFKEHGWIEPGEQIEESFLLPVSEDSGSVAFRLGLRIVSQGIEWNADSIVEIVPPGILAPGGSQPPYSIVLQNFENDQRTTDIEKKKHGSEA